MGKSVWENCTQPQCQTFGGSLLQGAASGWDLMWFWRRMRLFALKSDIDLCECETFFQGSEPVWYKLLLTLFSVSFATYTEDLGSAWIKWSSSSSITAEFAGLCPEEAAENTRWWVGDYYPHGHSHFLFYNLPSESSDFWHFSWVPSVRYKQVRALKVTGAAPGFGMLQCILMWCSTADTFPWYKAHHIPAVALFCSWSASDASVDRSWLLDQSHLQPVCALLGLLWSSVEDMQVPVTEIPAAVCVDVA